MTTIIQGEIRPFVIPNHPDSSEPDDSRAVVPLLRLRGYDRPVIEPEDCRVPDCLVCAWRCAGLLDSPVTRVTRVMREPAGSYLTCPSHYCPGCNALQCACLPEGYEEAVYEHDYALGHDHGTADGPDNRPSRRWLAEANLDADAYWGGYDAACAGVLLVQVGDVPVRLWDELDDGLPF